MKPLKHASIIFWLFRRPVGGSTPKRKAKAFCKESVQHGEEEAKLLENLEVIKREAKLCFIVWEGSVKCGRFRLDSVTHCQPGPGVMKSAIKLKVTTLKAQVGRSRKKVGGKHNKS